MIIDDWSWWFASHPESEHWNGPYPSRENAINEGMAALDGGPIYVARARQARFGGEDLVPDIDVQIHDWPDGQGEEYVGLDGETPFDHWTPSQRRSLEKHLRMAASEWMAAAGLDRRAAFMLHKMDAAERVDQPVGDA